MVKERRLLSVDYSTDFLEGKVISVKGGGTRPPRKEWKATYGKQKWSYQHGSPNPGVVVVIQPVWSYLVQLWGVSHLLWRTIAVYSLLSVSSTELSSCWLRHKSSFAWSLISVMKKLLDYGSYDEWGSSQSPSDSLRLPQERILVICQHLQYTNGHTNAAWSGYPFSGCSLSRMLRPTYSSLPSWGTRGAMANVHILEWRTTFRECRISSVCIDTNLPHVSMIAWDISHTRLWFLAAFGFDLCCLKQEFSSMENKLNEGRLDWSRTQSYTLLTSRNCLMTVIRLAKKHVNLSAVEH